MKKIMIIAAVAFLSTTALNAQTTFGAKAGVNFASLSGDGAEDLGSRTSFHLGLIAEYMFSEKFGIQPELLYSGQGAKEDDLTLALDYLAVPVMLKYYVTPGLSVEAGPQVAFNVSSKWKMDGESEDVEDVKTDIGAGLGLGYVLDQGIFFQARYNFGFTEIQEDAEAKNSVMQLSVGYRF